MALPYTILLVEDDALVRMFIVEELRDAGFHVVEASSGAAALAVLNANTPLDALFTDIRLGAGPDGWDVAEAFRAVHADKPVIYASGYTPGGLRKVPGGVFICKPYQASDIRRALHELLGVDTAAARPEADA